MATSPIPTNENELTTWMANFATKLPSHATELGLDPATVSNAVIDCDFLFYLLTDLVPVRTSDLSQAIAYKDLMKNGPIGTPISNFPVPGTLSAAPANLVPGTLPRLRSLVQTIKNSPGYNDAIGNDLHIIATPPVSPSSNPSPNGPTLTLIHASAGNVSIKWNKGVWTGVAVQGRLQGTAAWTDLGTGHYSPFVDSRPLAAAPTPEIREYQMCYLNKDTPTDTWSSALIVTVA